MRRREMIYQALPLAAALAGCGEPPSPQPPPAAAREVAAQPLASTETGAPTASSTAVQPVPAILGAGARSRCPADPAWASSPTMPTEVAKDSTDNCAFQQFAWQAFLFLTSVDGATQRPVFEGYMEDLGIFVGTGETPLAWGAQLKPPPGCTAKPGERRMVLRQVERTKGTDDPALQAIRQATVELPLVDKNQRWAQFGVSVNRVAYDFLTQCELYKQGCFKSSNVIKFSDGSVTLKTAWRVVETCDLPDSRRPCTPEDTSRYYTTKAQVAPYGVPAAKQACQEVTVALVGFHAVIKTHDHPEWIWATFEHVDDAPDCNNPAPPPPSGWTFNDPSSSATPNTFVNVCNPSDKSKFDKCDKPPTPTQVCRTNPQGGGSQDNRDNIVAINENVRRILPASSVWRNYALAGNLWENIHDGTPDKRPQAGSLKAANVTAETYIQAANCFACHAHKDAKDFSGKTAVRADLSHVFNTMQGGKACSGSRPPICSLNR